MRRVNYFDLGVNKGVTTRIMLRILERLKVEDYRVYGFEPMASFWEERAKEFSANPRIQMLKLAVALRSGKIRLFHSNAPGGHSIYSDKFNIRPDDWEEIDAVVFSEWLKSSGVELEGAVNILKANIEGAEWDLFTDLLDSNMIGKFQIVCGTPRDCWDVRKVEHLKDKADALEARLTAAGVHVHRFSVHEKHPIKAYANCKMGKLIKALL